MVNSYWNWREQERDGYLCHVKRFGLHQLLQIFQDPDWRVQPLSVVITFSDLKF